MNDEARKILKRLEELKDLRTTGFVDEAQYADSKAYLERKLIDAALKEAARVSADGPDDFAETQLMPPRAREPRARPRTRGRWLPWLAAAALVHLLALAAYWWSASGAADRSTDKSTAGKTAALDQTAGDAAALNANLPGVSPLEQPGAPPLVPPAAATIETVAGAAPVVSAGVSTGISGSVSLAPALSQGVRASDTVFVYARAVDGPPMPLAVIRKQVKDLPMNFTLDDSMATWPEAKVSAFPRIIVTARVSKSGEGRVRDGDLQGQSVPVSAGTVGLQIEIGTVVTGSP